MDVIKSEEMSFNVSCLSLHNWLSLWVDTILCKSSAY